MSVDGVYTPARVASAVYILSLLLTINPRKVLVERLKQSGDASVRDCLGTGLVDHVHDGADRGRVGATQRSDQGTTTGAASGCMNHRDRTTTKDQNDTENNLLLDAR